MRPRRQVPESTPEQVGDELVLPFELVDRSRSFGDGQVRWADARRSWFLGHGVDPADWSAVHPILVRSRTVHGCPLSLERSRIHAEARGKVRPPRRAG